MCSACFQRDGAPADREGPEPEALSREPRDLVYGGWRCEPAYDASDATPLPDRLAVLPPRPLSLSEIQLIAAAPATIFPELRKALKAAGWWEDGGRWHPPGRPQPPI